jgi:hypothetical protein
LSGISFYPQRKAFFKTNSRLAIDRTRENSSTECHIEANLARRSRWRLLGHGLDTPLLPGVSIAFEDLWL